MISTGNMNPAEGGKIDGEYSHEYARRAFFEWRGEKRGPPSPPEWGDFLEILQETRGNAAAFSLIERLLPYLNDRWGAGAADAAIYALRIGRCSPQGSSRTEWDRAEVAIARLPEDWQEAFRICLFRSRKASGRRLSTKDVLYSAATLRGAAYAMSAWHAWCRKTGRPLGPSALSFESWALEMRDKQRTPLTIAGRLRMVLIGLRMVFPQDCFDGAAWVSADWSDAARSVPPPTKQAAGVVPATEIFALGQRLLAELVVQPLHRITTACAYRDALLLMVAAALPQRARALSHLDSATTFCLLEWPQIRVNLPGTALKRREKNKKLPGYHATLENFLLWEACDIYLRDYRPVLDDGTHFWPSLRRRGKALDPQRLSEIIGLLTERHLGKRVSIHRVRDAVATEVCEHVPSGGQIASRLLDHSDPRIAGRHYDHSTGVVAARDLASLLANAARKRPSLLD